MEIALFLYPVGFLRKMPKTKVQKKKKTRSNATAETMAAGQRDISVSEFFAKNRYLLGFDNLRKAMLTAIKEAVDNALDACEEGGILPHIYVRVLQISESRFKLMIRDNGPGIVRAQIENIFGKLLYGSKFNLSTMTIFKKLIIFWMFFIANNSWAIF